MNNKGIILSLAYWIIPPGFQELITKFKDTSLLYVNKRKLSHICKNSDYKDIHKEKRCFILCNGPSVNKQDLIPLKDEIVFSVSSGYLHKDYPIIHPKYHCVPQVTYTELFTRKIAIEWFREMDNKIIDAELFLNYTEESLVRENNIFINKKVNYVCLNGQFRRNQSKVIDITRVIPGVQSVPIMCLMIAMYMGFKEIYLLGVDHDIYLTQKYEYPFKSTILAGKDNSVTVGGRLNCSLYDMFRSYINLWDQYRALKNIASENGISIYNSTYGGALDEFERVNLEDVIK